MESTKIPIIIIEKKKRGKVAPYFKKWTNTSCFNETNSAELSKKLVIA